MTFFQRSRQWLSALALVLLLTISTGCTATAESPTTTNVGYSQLERGNSDAGQAYGDWVVNAAQGLVSDAYVRDNDKLGVVITNSVEPSEVKDLSRSLLQGFRQSFPNKDLKVLVYAPDKELILQANYDSQSQEVVYEQPS
ncbi:MAG: hypothetical protein DCF25_20030 [Leptolyngbya foveolarum]|uniref:Uncharacterized protein n=1 Tax=Leptolyngbya foveolarum TaxID=47253 RepID=A0A2W4TQS4_9CYAN|nr:MAG: hypothetical protein DCF25_20030 [Leptolyngbya foveolarum]